jgi:pyrroline-5-carboxylate reductase
MDLKIGFIGCGKMAQAMIKGMISSGKIKAAQITVSTKTDATLKIVKESYGVHTTIDNKEVAEHSDLLFLAIKPELHSEIIKEIKDTIGEKTIIITVAAGITLKGLEKEFGKEIKAVRTMPNTPSYVGEGMTPFSVNNRLNKEDLQLVTYILQSFGKAEVISEDLMDSIPSISGASPAYVYMFIEALADGGVKNGLSRNQAYRLAAQAVMGAAKMVLETGKHPGELKDEVCTPGGATIEAVSALEQHGLRYAVLQAMEKCTDKAKNL